MPQQRDNSKTSTRSGYPSKMEQKRLGYPHTPLAIPMSKRNKVEMDKKIPEKAYSRREFLRAIGIVDTNGIEGSGRRQFSRFKYAVMMNKLNPTERWVYSLKKQEVLIEENAALKSENSRLSQFSTNMRISGAICVLSMGVGGGLISTFGSDSQSVWFGIGWGLVIIPGIFQFIKSVFGV